MACVAQSRSRSTRRKIRRPARGAQTEGIGAGRTNPVILDCNMPELSGVLLVQELRKSSDYADLPVTMLTGRRGDRDEDLARFACANDYMKKPFDPKNWFVASRRCSRTTASCAADGIEQRVKP